MIGKGTYLPVMPRKPIELPPAVTRAFVKDMRAFFAITDPMKRDEIAMRQMHALWEFQRPSDKRLRILDVQEMFHAMKDHA